MIDGLFIYFGAVFAVAATVRFYTKDLDDDLSPETREELALRLLCLGDSSVPITSVFNWVTRAFDRVFGERHFSWKCFLVSSFISASTFTTLVLYVSSANPEFNVSTEIFSSFPAVVLLVGIIVNVPSDYLALLETRWVIRFRISTFFRICLDVIFTYLIALGWLALLIALFFGFKIGLTVFWIVLIDPIHFGAAINYEAVDEDGAKALALVFLDIMVFYIFLARVVLVTSFVTSIWVWLYGVSDLVIRFLCRYKFLVNHLGVEVKPARAIGLIASILVLVIGMLAYPVLLLLF